MVFGHVGQLRGFEGRVPVRGAIVALLFALLFVAIAVLYTPHAIYERMGGKNENACKN